MYGDDLIDMVLHSFPSLVKLFVTGTTRYDFSRFSVLSTLQVLRIQLAPVIGDHMNDFDNTLHLPNLPNLHTFSLHLRKSIDIDRLDRLDTCFPALTTACFNLFSSSSFSIQEIGKSLPLCTKLVKVYVRGCGRNKQDIIHLLSKCKSLKTIHHELDLSSDEIESLRSSFDHYVEFQIHYMIIRIQAIACLTNYCNNRWLHKLFTRLVS